MRNVLSAYRRVEPEVATTTLPAQGGPAYTVKMPNRFFLWLSEYPSPVEIVPKDCLPQLPITDYRYFVRIMQYLDELLPDEGLTFILTWHVDDFHEVMEDAVILQHGDEQYQIPWYHGRVRAMFKVSGLRPNPVRETLRLPLSIAWRCLLRDARNSLTRFRRMLEYGLPGKISTPMYELPLGYFALLDFDPPPIEQRTVDVFFAGVLAGRGWSIRASVAARQQMGAALAAAKKALPKYRIEALWRPRKYDQGLGPGAYTQALANAKIALAPRGNIDETYRLLEAAKLGCVMVSEPLPSRWYFQNCPAIIVRKWSELPGVLSSLLNDPPKLKELSRRGLAWWDSTISEKAIAEFIIQRVPQTSRLRRQV